MARPAPEVLAWASSVLGSEVTAIRSLRLGGTPWLLRVSDLRAGGRNAVLRVIAARRAGETETEVAAMTHVARVAQAGLPVPELLGYDLAEQTGYALMLTGQVAGSGVIPAEPDPERPGPRRPGPGRMTAGLAWCTVTSGTATRCGTRTAT